MEKSVITDAVYKIGASHKVCQDYAITTPNKVVICDGCSTGRHVDVGARVLAHMDNVFDEKVFKDISKHLGLEQPDLSSTYLRLMDVNSQAYSFLRIGDGFLFRKIGETLEVHEYSYAGNAPYYIAYKHFGMDEQWETQFSDNTATETIWTFDKDFKLVDKNTVPCAGQKQFIEIWGVDQDYIGIASDGLSSFQDSNKNPVALDKVVPILFNYKNLNPGFLQRRVQMAEKEFAKLGWSHYDDLSMGVIVK